MTAAGVLKTTVRDIGPAVVREPSREGGAQTSSSTGGPTWVRPSSKEADPAQKVAPDRKTLGVVTRVTAGGILRTVVIDTLVGSEATGFTWTRRAKESGMTSWAGDSSRTTQEVAPPRMSVAPPRMSVAPPRMSVAPPRISVGPAPEVDPVVTKSAVQPTEGGVMSRLFADGDSGGGRAEPVGHMSAMATTAEAGPMTRGQMSAQSRQELSTFISTAVLPKTNRVYEKEWESFKVFVKKERKCYSSSKQCQSSTPLSGSHYRSNQEKKFHSIPTLSKLISIKTPMFCGPSSERLISRLFMALVSELLS
jgi:hypothetical protein